MENVRLKLKESAVLASEWYRENLLEGNFGKYQIMTFGEKGESIEVETNGIESSDCIRLFGVDIDNRLKFNTLMNMLVTYVRKPASRSPHENEEHDTMQQERSCSYIKLLFYHISLIVTLSGIFAVLVTKGN